MSQKHEKLPIEMNGNFLFLNKMPFTSLILLNLHIRKLCFHFQVQWPTCWAMTGERKGKREERNYREERGKIRAKIYQNSLFKAPERAHREFKKTTFLAPIWTSKLIIYVCIFISSFIPSERDKIITIQSLLIIYQVPRTAYTSSHSTRYHCNTRRQLFWLPSVMGWTVAPKSHVHLEPVPVSFSEEESLLIVMKSGVLRGDILDYLGALILIRREDTHKEDTHKKTRAEICIMYHMSV